MKKLVTAACALAAGMAIADVTSGNTVGYTTMAAPQGRFIITGVQLDEVGSDGVRPINDLLTGLTSVYYDDDNLFQTTATQVQIPVPGGYNIYYYLEDGWYRDNGVDAYKPGWCTDEGVLVSAEVTPGVAMWLKSVPDSATALVSGEVSADNAASVSCPANFALRANAFPVAITLNDGATMTVSGATVVLYDDDNLFQTTAPQVQIPVPGGYNIYYYLEDGWYRDNGVDAYKPGWCTDEGVLVDNEISVAQGFWTKGVGSSFTLNFAK